MFHQAILRISAFLKETDMKLQIDKSFRYIFPITDGAQTAYIILKAFDFANGNYIVIVVIGAAIDFVRDFPRP